MRDNPVKTRIAAGGHAFGAMIFEFFTPGIAQICKAAGAEFILFDMEHTAVSTETLRQQMALCRGLGIAPYVRVPAAEYDFIARMLDVGAMGIMVPMVDTAEQAAFIASCCRYPPVGRRGAAFGVAHDDFEPGPVLDKIQRANERTLVICQIETAVGAQNCDSIAAVPGVDVLWVGHFDLTNFMGIPGQFDHPRYLEAVDAVVAACDRHGKTPAFMASDRKWMQDYLGKGFRLMAYGLDISIFQNALAEGIGFMREQAAAVPTAAPAPAAAPRSRARVKAGAVPKPVKQAAAGANVEKPAAGANVEKAAAGAKAVARAGAGTGTRAKALGKAGAKAGPGAKAGVKAGPAAKAGAKSAATRSRSGK